jgi:hypothetical protein
MSHGAGLVAARWRDGTPGVEATPIALPARLTLQGQVQKFRLDPREPVLLRAVSGASAEIRIGTARRWLQAQGGVVSAYLPAGPVELSLRALAGGALSGGLELTGSPVVPVDEGLGPEVLLPPGGSQAFGFHVVRAGPVGVGARAVPDVVACELLDARGETVGQGVVQMHDLAAGDYVLVLRAPASAGPVRLRPAVVGIRMPPSGPPEEVIRQYREMVRQGEGSR